MALATDRETMTVALIGNPNTGKSTLFGALSGVQQRVGNYPGVTVEKKLGQMAHAGRRWTLVDLPGTYSLAPRSPDEMVAVDVLLGRRQEVAPLDVILCVVDANNLERNLYLVSQVLELGRPTVVALTMVDVARGRGLVLDLDRLGRQLGVPVVPVHAQRGQGLGDLKEVLAGLAGRPAQVPESPFPEPFRREVDQLQATLAAERPGEDERWPRYLVERLVLDSGGSIERQALAGSPDGLRAQVQEARDRLAQVGCPVPAVEAMARYGWVAQVVEGVVTRPDQPVATLGDRLDALLTHRFWGSVILAVLMLVIFCAVFYLAQYPMEAIDSGVSALAQKIETSLPEGALRSLLVEGVMGGVGAVIIFLPQILILFFFLGVLEDCGYLARAAYLMDRLMVRLGLSGKSFIPLLSSFACAIPGVMATRVIEDRRDRLTTILVAPLMSCSARWPVYATMIAAFIPARFYLGGFLGLQGITMFAMYLTGIVVAAVVALLLKKTLLRGATPPFVMELPAYKWPAARVVITRMLERGWDFLGRAGTIIFAVSVVMWALLYYPRLPQEVTRRFEVRLAAAEQMLTTARTDTQRERLNDQIAELEARQDGEQRRQSLLGRGGRLIEPMVRPLGWDWRIGAGVLASFPAREVVVATLGVIFDVGEVENDDAGITRLGTALRSATWPESSRPLFTTPVALSIMVFFALCAQCVSTLAVIRRETQSWAWPAFSFAYMTTLAYVGALATYQIGTLVASWS